MRGLLRGLGWLLVLTMVLTAGVITASRLLEPAGRRWVQVEAFTPYAMVLYLLIALVGLIWLLRARRWGRLVPVALLLVAALGLGAHVSWFLPQVSGSNPPPSADADPFRVMTANLAGDGGEALALVESAADEQVDVLVVQEITPSALEEMRAGGLDDLFPSSAGRPAPGVRGTMVFSRFELGDPEALETRMASFQVPMAVGDEELALVAVHPVPPVVDSWADEQRVVTDWIRAHEPDLVVGDFNATADHRPMRHRAEAGYRSVTELANEGLRPTWPVGRLLPPVPLAQIDHVLCGPRVAALSSHTVRLEGTDHLALVAEVAGK